MVDLVVEGVVDRKYYYRDQNGNLLLFLVKEREIGEKISIFIRFLIQNEKKTKMSKIIIIKQ